MARRLCGEGSCPPVLGHGVPGAVWGLGQLRGAVDAGQVRVSSSLGRAARARDEREFTPSAGLANLVGQYEWVGRESRHGMSSLR